MAWRVDPEDVREILDTDSSVEMQPFIVVANRLVTKLAAADTNSLMSAEDLREVELYLAAHFYALKDPQAQSESTGGASQTHQGQTGMQLDLTWWGQMAKMIDETGWLDKLTKSKARPEIEWLGLPVSSQTDYDQRD